MVIEAAIVLIGWFVVPVVNELIQAAREYAGKKLSSPGKELKELEEGLAEINSMVGVEAERKSIRRDRKVVMESLLRLKGAAQAAESILGDRRTTGKAMEFSVDYLSKSLDRETELRPQGLESIPLLVDSFLEKMEAILRKENVEATDPRQQTLRKLTGSATSLRKPVSSKPEDEPVSSKPLEQPREGRSLRKPVLSKPLEQPNEGKSLRKPVLSMPLEQPREGRSLRKPVLSKPLERPNEGKSLRKPALSMPVEQPLQGKSLRRPVLSMPVEQALEEKSIRKSALSMPLEPIRKLVLSMPVEQALEGKSIRKPALSMPLEPPEVKSLRKPGLSKLAEGRSLSAEGPPEGKSLRRHSN
ncbi:uncharacterized protein LOC124675194 [Lolium rigidum]|uniref:uncharacterized protein LOC124675194 n=1 Tax=Lolium rigidum TaxID=89674 RepID=UPI001F5CB61D|nr:uncharacterized protein LOC124675194 [Lolium rigidum]